MTLLLEHTPAEGTLIHGTSRGDGSAEVLRTRPGGLYWKWSGRQGFWYVPRSIDTRPKAPALEAVAAALRAAGLDVELDVDDSTRPTAEVVADKRERAADRAEGLRAKAERHAGASRAAFAAEHQILDAIPPGQPILVGHHSERRHRRALERAHSLMERGSEHAEIAADAERRAEIAELAASGREARSTVSNRIDKLRAEIAVDLRTLYGRWRRWGESHNVEWDAAAGGYVYVYRPVDPDSDYGRELIRRITDATEARLYWTDVLAAMTVESGVDVTAIRKGDAIKLGRGRGAAWHRVVRVNPKSFSVPSGLYAGHTLTYRKEEVVDHRPAGAAEPTPVALDGESG